MGLFALSACDRDGGGEGAGAEEGGGSPVTAGGNGPNGGSDGDGASAEGPVSDGGSPSGGGGAGGGSSGGTGGVEPVPSLSIGGTETGGDPSTPASGGTASSGDGGEADAGSAPEPEPGPEPEAEPEPPDSDVAVEGVGENAPDVDVDASTLRVTTDGVLWLFTVENTGTTPACGRRLAVKLYDADGEILAGSELGSPFIDEETPSLSATVVGSPYFAEGRQLLSCVSPGGRAIGRGGVISPQNGVALNEEDNRAIAESAARLEYTFYPGSSSDGYELADTLIQVRGAMLVDGPDGKVVEGTAVGAAQFNSWQVHAGLFDTEGRVVDYVSIVEAGLMDGEERSFQLPPGDPSAVRFEIYLDAQLQL